MHFSPFKTYKAKLMFFLVTFIFTTVAINLLIQLNVHFLHNYFDKTYRNIESINTITTNFNTISKSIQTYVISGDSDSILNVYDSLNSIAHELNQITCQNEDEVVFKRSIANIYTTISSNIDMVILFKKQGKDYTQKLSDTIESLEYANYFLQKLTQSKINYSVEYYNSLKDSIKKITNTNYVVIILWFISSIFISLVFTKELTDPISRLAKFSNRVAKGELNFTIPKVEPTDELGILNNSFSDMLENIKDMLKKLEDKAELEKELAQKEIETVKYQQALQEAELKTLQAQINPHFLFNTLNTITQIAMFENAQKTYDMLIKTSNYLRYCVQNINKLVTIGDEIENVKNYLFIHNIRFGNKINLELEVEKDVESAKIPSMIFQPIVENSIVHGFAKKSEGLIKIVAKKENQSYVKIHIIDNGSGIEPHVLEELTKKSYVSKTSTGIGLENITKRLEFFFAIKNPISIKSQPNVGTTVTIVIPYIK